MQSDVVHSVGRPVSSVCVRCVQGCWRYVGTRALSDDDDVVAVIVRSAAAIRTSRMADDKSWSYLDDINVGLGCYSTAVAAIQRWANAEIRASVC